MGYTKNTWQTGDVVTAAKLNNMENGIADANSIVLIVSVIEEDDIYLSNTWQEIHDAIENGKIVYCVRADSDSASRDPIYQCVHADGSEPPYYCHVTPAGISDDAIHFGCNSPNERPKYIEM